MKVIKVGRSSSMDKTINDGKVSRRHCQITQHDNGSYSIIDIGSSNGTYVNGHRVNGEERLAHGDVVRIGNTVLPWEQYFELNKNQKTITIGRGHNNDLNIADNKVSRAHCQIVCFDDGTYAIEDLGSTNGTYVNGMRINRRTPLRHGDRVKIGNTYPSWEAYIDPNGTEIGTGTGLGTEIGMGTGSNIGDYNERGKTTEGTGIWTLLIGLASFGCIIYIVVNYFTLFGQKLVTAFGGAEATLKYFPIYLHGTIFKSGQWLPMIAAVVLGLLTDLVDFLTGEKEDKLASAGQWLGNAGAVVGGIFIVLAIFAEKIAQVL